MNSHSVIAAAYDRVAQWYDEWTWQTFWDRNEVPLVRAAIWRMGHVRRAVDLGTGTGRYLAVLREAGIEASGIDASVNMISIAAAKLGSRERLLVGDLTSATFAPLTFDLAVAARVFCHVEDVAMAFRAAAKMVVLGGRLVVTELDVEHPFEQTFVPTPNGKEKIRTWKRTSGDLIRAAAASGWQPDSLARISVEGCAWIPEAGALSSIDRSTDRPIFRVITLRRV